MGTVRRSGVIIAMSSGLVASMALPAHAANQPPEAAGPATASIPVIPASGAGDALFVAPETGVLGLPYELALDDLTVAAPVAATVDFDHSSFIVLPDGQTGRTGARDVPTVQEAVGAPAQRSDDAADEADDEPAPAPVARRRPPAAPSPVTDTPVTKSAGKTSTTDTAKKKAAPTSTAAMGAKIVAIAHRYEDTPYVWGGTTARGFDCSGFTKHVYGQVGKKLGRTVAAQRGDVQIIPRSKAVPGDLIFFGNSHIAIYLGGNMMIDAPRRGKTVQPRKIYSSNVQFGRVL